MSEKENLLLEKMKESEVTQRKLAELLGKSESVVSRKINKEVKFTVTEKMVLSEILKMSDEEKIKFFYA